MVNTKLVRELEKKNKGHILFDYQKQKTEKQG